VRQPRNQMVLGSIPAGLAAWAQRPYMWPQNKPSWSMFCEIQLTYWYLHSPPFRACCPLNPILYIIMRSYTYLYLCVFAAGRKKILSQMTTKLNQSLNKILPLTCSFRPLCLVFSLDSVRLTCKLFIKQCIIVFLSLRE
jgi:hypothetical protein